MTNTTRPINPRTLPEKAVYFAIRRRPGQTFTELRNTLGATTGTVWRRVAALKEKGLITVTHGPRTTRIITPIEPPILAERLFGKLPPLGKAAPREPYVTQARYVIIEYIQTHPGTRQNEIATTTKLSRALVSYHIKELIAAGTLAQHKIERGGRRYTYTTTV